MVLNGDLLTDLDLTALAEQHERTGAVATIGLHPVDDPSSYGLVRRDEDGRGDASSSRSPTRQEIDTDEVNAGAYVLERAVIDLIEPGRAVSIEREVFPRLVGQGLYGRRLDGYWMDIGTPERYLQASWDILEGAVQTELPGTGGPFVGPGAEVAPGADVAPRAVVAERARVAVRRDRRRLGAARRLPGRARGRDPGRDPRPRGRGGGGRQRRRRIGRRRGRAHRARRERARGCARRARRGIRCRGDDPNKP